VNREELKLVVGKRSKDAKIRGGFVLAHTEARQNSLSGDGDVARERGWINAHSASIL